MSTIVEELPADATHRDAERAFRAAGWMPCGEGDWAFALRSPEGDRAVRISPFDPVGPYTAALYREAAHTRQVPRLFAHRRLTGGGDLQVMEWLNGVDEQEATDFHAAITDRAPRVAELVDIVRRVHADALRELPWCGPLDQNPSNIRRGGDGRLVACDLYYADGPALYETAGSDPAGFVERIPEHERRFMTEIPLAVSGPWDAASREAMRAGLMTADAARG